MILKLQREDANGGKSLTLNIRLERMNSKRKSSRAFVPRFPKVKVHFVVVFIIHNAIDLPLLYRSKTKLGGWFLVTPQPPNSLL